MAECVEGVYRPRRPREAAFYRLVEEHYERFEQVYPDSRGCGAGTAATSTCSPTPASGATSAPTATPGRRWPSRGGCIRRCSGRSPTAGGEPHLRELRPAGGGDFPRPGRRRRDADRRDHRGTAGRARHPLAAALGGVICAGRRGGSLPWRGVRRRSPGLRGVFSGPRPGRTLTLAFGDGTILPRTRQPQQREASRPARLTQGGEGNSYERASLGL